MTTVAEHYGHSDKGSDFLCGVEFEIETIQSHGDAEKYFVIEKDNSLRNSGYEYKCGPLDYATTLERFKFLHNTLDYSEEEDAFSERTSIHVHVNVRSLSLAQLRQLTLTYALLEPLFFEFVGEKRAGSIYCVPLSYTYLPSLYNKNPVSLVDLGKWHKYTAFNVLPIRDLGTVEFRHMYGTNDFATFHTWLTTIYELYNFIKDNPDFDLVKHLDKYDNKEEAASTTAHIAIPTLYNTLKPHPKLLENTMLDVALSCGGLK
jgi:hypothetical protein